MKRLFVTLLLFVFSAGTAFPVTIEKERKVGAQVDKQVRKRFRVLKDPAIQKYVSSIGQKVLSSVEDPEFTFRFTVLEHPMLNAFALPGGYVYVTTGMLAYLDSEAALASVLGHEIGHVVAHHAFKQQDKSFKDALLILAGVAAGGTSGLIAGSALSRMSSLGYGRKHEMQADELGMIYAYQAGYDPRESSKMFETLRFKQRVSGVAYHSFQATHPDTIERIIRDDEKSRILINRGMPVSVESDKYRNAIRGITWGRLDRKRRTGQQYRLEIYRTKRGDTFRTIAKEISGDESLAFEVAVMNAYKPEEKPPVGLIIKVPVPRKRFKDAKQSG